MPTGETTFRFIMENAIKGGVSGGVSGGGSGGGGGGTDKSEPNPQPPEKAQAGGFKSALKSLGINVTLANLLRQSQVFTGILNSMFQVIGAVLDVALAPLLPFLGKFLKNSFPVLIAIAERIGNFLSGELAKLEELGIIGYLEDLFNRIFRTLTSSVFDDFQDLVFKFIGLFFPGFSEKLEEGLEKFKTLVSDIFDGVLNVLEKIPGVGKIIKNLREPEKEGEETGANKAGVGGFLKGITKLVTENKVARGLGKVAGVAGKLIPGVALANVATKIGAGAIKRIAAPLGAALDLKEVYDVYKTHGLGKAAQLGAIKAASYGAGTLAAAGLTAATGGVGVVGSTLAFSGASMGTEYLLRKALGFDKSLTVNVAMEGTTENTVKVAQDQMNTTINANHRNDSSIYTGAS